MVQKLLAVVAAAGLLPSVALGTTAALYKSPSCGCCAAYVEHPPDLGQIKRPQGVNPRLASCHTMVLGGYTFEGHVPVDAIERVLGERPPIRGLAVPGMPGGSPGMDGTLRPSLRVLTLSGEVHATYFRPLEWSPTR